MTTTTAIAGGTKIEWADFTFNPWWGCEKVSPGCAHCYADTLARRRAPGSQLWGAGHGFRLFGDGHWAEPLKWARLAPAKLGRRPRVFCASMADVFEERPELEEPRRRLFDLIADTPEVDWLLLTKRPEFACDWLRSFYRNHAISDWVSRDRIDWGVYPNIWTGVSIENARFTWRADVLREIPAAVRFISAEPLLGSLFNGPWLSKMPSDGDLSRPLDLTGIDWLIVGGESGHGARPMHPEWAREIRDACLRAGGMRRLAEAVQHPAFFFKQWGEYAPVIGHINGSANLHVLDRKGRPEPWTGFQHGSITAWDREATDGRGSTIVQKVGKKRAGRLLDGREWSEFPRSCA